MHTITEIMKFLAISLFNERGSLSLDGGDAAPAEGEAPAPDGLGELPPVEFPEGLDETVTNDPSLKVFVGEDNKINYGNLMKSYVHAQKKMGEKGITIPDKHATEEDWANFHNAIRPSDLEKYEVKNSLDEGTVLDDAMFGKFKELAHKSGMTAGQAQGVLDWYNGFAKEMNETNTTNANMAYEKEVKALKEDWGDALNNEMALAQRALKEFGGDDTLAYLKESGLDKNVQLIRLFNKIGHGLMEDKFQTESHGNFGVTKEEAQVKINQLYADPKGAYYDKTHPNHNNVVEEMAKLSDIAYGA